MGERVFSGRARVLVFVAFGILPAACATTYTLPAFRKVTHCEVRTNLNELRRRIDRPEQLAAVIAFVNARRDGWTVPWYGVPVPKRNAYCYANSKLLGHFGAGQNFFGAQQEGGFFSREATRTELDEFLRLVGEQ